MAMYHWEADQENFLVLAGEALLVVEGEECPLRQSDFVHCPAGRSTSPSGPERRPAWYEAYARFAKRQPTRFREGWLPD